MTKVQVFEVEDAGWLLFYYILLLSEVRSYFYMILCQGQISTKSENLPFMFSVHKSLLFLAACIFLLGLSDMFSSFPSPSSI